ncbi:increased DNA methylation 1-like [Miscanthus floridulus]|uniref:increased DNA methylation 1-like n=1 Tax=Miscanthus floridulus TaxID=154761 RepID=UPI00345AB60F
MKLAVVLGVLNECFNPVKDGWTRIDMLHQAVYSLGSEFKWLSYEGLYTMVLKKHGEIVSAAIAESWTGIQDENCHMFLPRQLHKLNWTARFLLIGHFKKID